MNGTKVKLPFEDTAGILFAFENVSYSPEAPVMNEPFTVKGKVNLLKIPFFGPLWIIATVTYPETWWEEIIPIIGAPEVRSTDIALGGDFEIKFPGGFQREGEFGLSVRVYPGPTFPIDSIVLPPAPAAATIETTFIVAGEAPPQEELFRGFRIASYSKNGGTPVTPPDILELDVGDRCRVNLVFDHQGPAVSGKIHAAIWHKGTLDPHDEILYKEQSFSAPKSDDWETYEASVDIIITSAISPGSDYGLYAKIIGITGGDVFTEYLENVITIAGAGEPQVTGLQVIDYDTPVEAGYKCKVRVSFEHRGPATSKTLYAAIGNEGAIPFDEILAGSKRISLPLSESPTEFEADVPISITAAIDPTKSPYDVYAKIDSVISPALVGVIEVTGAPAEEGFRNVQVTDYDTPVESGDTCKIRVSFEYRGPATSKTLYAAIGNDRPDWQGGFDEILKGSRSVSIAKSDNWTTYESYVNITITSALDPSGSPYDVYAKIGGEVSPAILGVIAVTSPPSEGSIISKYINKAPEGSRISLPATVKADGNTFEVGVTAKNTSSAPFFGGVEVKVYDPSGTLRAAPTVDYAGIDPGETLRWEYDICEVDKAGSWTIKVRFLDRDTSEVLDEEQSTMTATAVAVTVSFKMSIWGIPSDFGSYDHWSCYYFNPATGGFVSDYKWYSPSSRISFSNVEPGGYVAVILARGSEASDYYYSPSFTAVDGGIYQYDLQLNRISKISY